MEVKEVIPGGPVVIYPTVHGDDRGYFFESFNEKSKYMFNFLNIYLKGF